MTSPKLRIGIFTDDYYPNSGGIAKSIELQIKSLHSMGHDVTLFAPKTFLVPPKECQYEAMPVIRFPKSPSFLCSLQFSKKIMNQVIANHKLDIVHSQNERGALFLAARIARQTGIPHIHTFHSNYAGTHKSSPIKSAINTLSFMQFAPLMLKILRSDIKLNKVRTPTHLEPGEESRFASSDWKSLARLAQYTDAFTSPAPFVIDNINDSAYDKTASKSFVIANGVNPLFAKAQRTRAYDDSVRFLSCGRLDPEKRVDVTIKAFARLNKEDTELHIIGSGAEANKLQKLAKATVKKGRVEFLGHPPDNETVADEFANADVYVFSSYRFDTQGMVLGEAASAGAAILYCDDRLKVGVSDKNALLVKPSVNAISEGMLTLYNDPARRLEMSKHSREIGKGLTLEIMEESFVRVYHYALNATKH